jgi:hypothetical protein
VDSFKVCLDGLWKATKRFVKIATFRDEIRTRDLQNTKCTALHYPANFEVKDVEYVDVVITE